MKTALITGSGFVGKHLTAYLIDKGFDATVMARNIKETSHLPKAAKLISTDIRYLEKGFEFDYVFHLAAVSIVRYADPNYMQAYESNVMATLNLLQHVKARERFIFASTAAVYKNGAILSETSKVAPISIYGLSKVAGEDLVKYFNRKYGLKYTIFRFFNLYGEGQSNLYLITQLIEQAIAGEITVLNRKSKRDYLYVKDLVKGITQLGQNKDTLNETINMGTGKAVSSGEMIDIITKLVSKNVVINNKNIIDPTSPMSLVADISKAKSMGFNPTTTLEDGIRNMLKEGKQ